jgi:hypothetical protein
MLMFSCGDTIIIPKGTLVLARHPMWLMLVERVRALQGPDKATMERLQATLAVKGKKAGKTYTVQIREIYCDGRGLWVGWGKSKRRWAHSDTVEHAPTDLELLSRTGGRR